MPNGFSMSLAAQWTTRVRVLGWHETLDLRGNCYGNSSRNWALEDSDRAGDKHMACWWCWEKAAMLQLTVQSSCSPLTAVIYLHCPPVVTIAFCQVNRKIWRPLKHFISVSHSSDLAPNCNSGLVVKQNSGHDNYSCLESIPPWAALLSIIWFNAFSCMPLSSVQDLNVNYVYVLNNIDDNATCYFENQKSLRKNPSFLEFCQCSTTSLQTFHMKVSFKMR